MPKNKKTKKDYTYAVGRRKSASARVRLYLGKGESTVNGIPVEKYFPGNISKSLFLKPLKVAEATDRYYVSVKVVGGGKNGQLEAVIHGIARALSKAGEEKYKLPLKKAGLLTRDSRIRERDTGGKARRKKQSPKR